MTGVDVNVLSVVTVGNNVSLMPGVDVNELSIVTVGNNVSLMTYIITYSSNGQYIYIYTRHQ
jgi:acetyltransferase-like isoleucine patch superfamily enzyme